MSAAVTCQPSAASQIASAPSPQPASSAVPGTRLLISRARYGFGTISRPAPSPVRLLPVGLPVVLVESLRHHASVCPVSTACRCGRESVTVYDALST